jgi:hypothetical protein
MPRNEIQQRAPHKPGKVGFALDQVCPSKNKRENNVLK